MLLTIVIEPNQKLHEKTRQVTPGDLETKEIRKLIKNMVETMRVKDGVGLAGPQVGSDLSICVIHGNYSDPDKKRDLILVNPTWEKIDNKTELDSEGCLSVPGVFGKVKRYKKIKVQALDPEGHQLDFMAQDFFARIIQHEVDHLNGILFIEKAEDIQSFEEM